MCITYWIGMVNMIGIFTKLLTAPNDFRRKPLSRVNKFNLNTIIDIKNHLSKFNNKLKSFRSYLCQAENLLINSKSWML